jgi:hypothetical protein
MPRGGRKDWNVKLQRTAGGGPLARPHDGSSPARPESEKLSSGRSVRLAGEAGRAAYQFSVAGKYLSISPW